MKPKKKPTPKVTLTILTVEDLKTLEAAVLKNHSAATLVDLDMAKEYFILGKQSR